MQIHEKIKTLRELRNFTREYVAEELGVSVSGYSKIERGEVDLTLSKLEKLAKILNVEIAQILNFDVNQIFNLNNNNIVQAPGAKAENMNFYSDDYKEKYIKLLEDEINRLKIELNKFS